MARYKIYSKDGKTVRYEGAPRFSSSYMGVDFLEFSVRVPSPIDWQIGDYVQYDRTGMTYFLYSIPHPTKVSQKNTYGGAFQYNVILYASTKDLEIAPFRDVVANDNMIHFSTRKDFSTYEDVYGVARRIQASLDEIYPGKWVIEVVKTTDEKLSSLLNEVKDFQSSGENCLTILSKIYDLWKNVGWIHRYDNITGKNTIIIGGANVRLPENTTKQFSYGKGNGLISLRKSDANNGECFTRLYVYGSERNIQTRYYNNQNILNKDSVDIANLMIPIDKWGLTNGLPDARKAYIQADDATIAKYGIRPRTVYFDGNENEDIYPSIQGLTMSQVRQEMVALGQGGSPYLPDATNDRIDKIGFVKPNAFHSGSKLETEKQKKFELGIPQNGLDLIEQGKLTQDGYAIISMKTGKCAGREFKARKKKDTFTLSTGTKGLIYEFLMEWDESIGMGFPNTTYPIESGDEFVILNIPMPNFYITIAEKRLFTAGEKMLKDYTSISAFYEPSIDPIQMIGYKLLAGMYMAVKDEDIVNTPDNVDYVLIDTLSIDEKTDIPKYEVTLREQKRSARNFDAIEDMVEDAKQESSIENNKNKQYTNRRFHDVQETMLMLQGAFKNFSEGINPVTVQTMHMIVGDERQQFIYTETPTSDKAIQLKYNYESATDVFHVFRVYVKHMTIGIKSISSIHHNSEYLRWEITPNHWQLKSGIPYYLYIKANKLGIIGEFIISEVVCEDTESDYLFLAGIINSDFDGQRTFVPMNGYTEVRPGQITTELLRSSDGKSYINLLTGDMALGQKLKYQNDVLTLDSIFAEGADIGGWTFKNGRLESKKKHYNGAPMSYFDGRTGEVNVHGIIRMSTGISGNISDSNIFYLPSITQDVSLSMGMEQSDIGKVCRLFNSSPYGGAIYKIDLHEFFLQKSPNGSIHGKFSTTIAEINPQCTVEFTCFELPNKRDGETYEYVGMWRETNKWNAHGCRPTRTISHTSGNTDLTINDHTIIIDTPNIVLNLQLPDNPSLGQEYIFICVANQTGGSNIVHSNKNDICWPDYNHMNKGNADIGNKGSARAIYAQDRLGNYKWWFTRIF